MPNGGTWVTSTVFSSNSSLSFRILISRVSTPLIPTKDIPFFTIFFNSIFVALLSSIPLLTSGVSMFPVIANVSMGI